MGFAMSEIRGELRCFNCARYLGEFESHPDEHGAADIHFIEPEFGQLSARAIRGEDGRLQCSRCGGRVLTEWMDRVAA